jgi:predicted PurR-regulated permease PerM
VKPVVGPAKPPGDLIGLLQDVAVRYNIGQAADLLRVPILDRAVRWVSRFAPISAVQVQSWTVQGGPALLRMLVGVSGVLLSVVNFILMLSLLLFFLRDGEEMAARAIRLIPMEAERKARPARHLTAVTRAVVLGSLVTALVQGLLLGIGLAFAGLPSPVVFGVLAAIASLVPLVGTALIRVPASVVLFAGWGLRRVSCCWGGTGGLVCRPLHPPPAVHLGPRPDRDAPGFPGLMGGSAPSALSAFSRGR